MEDTMGSFAGAGPHEEQNLEAQAPFLAAGSLPMSPSAPLCTILSMLAPVPPIRPRLERLRDAMAVAKVHAVLVPSSDPHVSEYLPARWQGREWFSGFTGSMGTLV